MAPLEEFYRENAETYLSLTRKWSPGPATKSAAVDGKPNQDMIVCARIRPVLDTEEESGIPAGIFSRGAADGVLDLHEMRQAIKSNKPVLKSAQYQVDKAYDVDSTTENIYTDVVKSLIPWAWGGGISTLFAYGQTGSGKTFTVSRLEELVAIDLMKLEGNRKVYMSVFELAGNNAFDLLNSRKPVSVLEDSFGVVQVAGALEHHVTKADDIVDYIRNANSFRQVASTEKNDTSSRSHAVCRFRIEVPDIPSVEDGILYMIDLAGSEAARDRRAHLGNRALEGRQINTSLSVLKDCIRGKAEWDALMGTSKKKPYIPFRQAALTKVLKHVFDPVGSRTSKTVVVACVNPSLLDLGASKNTLRYAEMLRVLLPKNEFAKEDENVPLTWGTEMLKRWIKTESGNPPINSEILALQESGASLLRLPPAEFELRCLKTPDVEITRAKAFRSKLWQLHIDSTRPGGGNKTSSSSKAGGDGGTGTALGHLKFLNVHTSRDNDKEAAEALPFAERLRPGMCVSYRLGGDKLQEGMTGSKPMAVLLCPVPAVRRGTMDMFGDKLVPEGNEDKWLCALIAPTVSPEAYEVNLWRQAAIGKSEMLEEVIMEYDIASRYYYVAI